MRNLIITWASGEDFCKSEGFRVYLKSLKNIDLSNVDVVFVTHDMPEETRAILKTLEFNVYDVDPNEVGYPIGDRHLHFWRYLAANPDKYNQVLHTDCRDVVFQRDPFKLVRYSESFVLLTNEGMPPSSNGFHCIEQFKFQQDIPPLFRKEVRDHVLNGGIAMGTAADLKSHFFLIWALSIKMSPDVTDQAALNYLFNFLDHDQTYKVAHPALDSFCLTGEAVKDSFIESDFRDGVFYHRKLNEPYVLVHQWDRTKYQENVLAHYLE